MKRLFGKIYKKPTKKKWKDIEYFNSDWKTRIKSMSKYIDKGMTVLDLGCGEMWLKEFLNDDNNYIPVDYTIRGADTIVCDFNKYEYPKVNADLAFVSGCLEYVEDYEWFADKIARNHNKCILSYCIIEDFHEISARKNKAWKNHLSEKQIVNLFINRGYKLINKEYGYSTFYVFEK